MTRPFDEFAAKKKVEWDDDTRAVYESASQEFAEFLERNRDHDDQLILTMREAEQIVGMSVRDALKKITGASDEEIERMGGLSDK